MRGNRGLRAKLSRIPIDATKNIVQFNIQVPTVTVGGIALAVSVPPASIDESVIADSANCEQGCMIRGMSIQGRIYSESGVADSNSTVWLIRKNEGNILPVPTLGQINSIGTVAWKNKIFHTEQAIVGSQVSGWPMGFVSIKIPKRFHVMKQNDRWELYIANNTANNLRFCGIALYKWYR